MFRMLRISGSKRTAERGCVDRRLRHTTSQY